MDGRTYGSPSRTGPLKLRTSTSHEEGCERDWAIGAKAFLGDNGWVTGVQTVRLEWRQEADGRWTMQEIAGSETVLPAERVLLALGFVHPVHEGMLQQLEVARHVTGQCRPTPRPCRTGSRPSATPMKTSSSSWNR